MGVRLPVRGSRNPYRGDAPSKSLATKMYAISAEGANGANIISVTMQLKDARGRNLTGVRRLRCWLSDSATTGAIAAAGASANGAIGGGIGAMLNIVIANKMFDLVTNATGQFRLDLTDAGAHTMYLYAEMPTGEVAVSPALTWT